MHHSSEEVPFINGIVIEVLLSMAMPDSVLPLALVVDIFREREAADSMVLVVYGVEISNIEGMVVILHVTVDEISFLEITLELLAQPR